jgi:hypothetical protein
MKNPNINTIPNPRLKDDPSTLTPADATALFTAEAQHCAAEQFSNDFILGWAETRRLYPQLLKRMTAVKKPGEAANTTEAALANGRQHRAGEYAQAFETELSLCSHDPIIAHRRVMSLPKYAGLAIRQSALANAAKGADTTNATAIGDGIIPPKNAITLAALGLPIDATDEEYQAYCKANGGACGLNAAKANAVLLALVEALQRKESWTMDQALVVAKNRFPFLWAAAHAPK